jgi:hypothetical protein
MTHLVTTSSERELVIKCTFSAALTRVQCLDRLKIFIVSLEGIK